MTHNTSSHQTLSNWKLFLEILGKQVAIRKSLFWLLPLLFVYVTLVVSEPYFYKLFVDNLQVSIGKPELFAQTSSLFVQISVIWVLLVLLSIGTFTLYDFSIQTLMHGDWKKFALTTSEKMMQLPMDYHISTNLGERQKIYDRGIDAIWNTGYEMYLNILPQIFIFISLLIFGFYINPLMMVISLSVMPIGIIISMTVGKKVHILQKTANDLWDKVFGRF